MRIERRFTKEGVNPLDQVNYERRACIIKNPDESIVFQMDDAEVPKDWTQLASDILISKYFRKAGVPMTDAQGAPAIDANGEQSTGPETSVKQVVDRLAGGWRDWGKQYGYFGSSADADCFYDELCHMLVHQMAAPNSPQWFNTGLHNAYGMTGPAQGHFYADPATGQIHPSTDAYTHPQPHACFIQQVTDDLVNEGGIMDLWVREARLFKYGSGTGTNFSSLRGEGESLAGGGTSSGLMSWLKIGDRAAGAIKSGGTTRRAAKMVCLDIDHPDVEKFISWKVEEEKKVAALAAAGYSTDFNGEAYQTVSGQNSNNSVRLSNEFFEAVIKDLPWQLRWRTNPQHVSRNLPARELWRQISEAAWRCADPGVQCDTTINQWHTCPESGRINASNPCSEYMFLDDTACNLASINLMKFYDADSGRFDIEGFCHAVRLWTIVLEISVLMAQYPSSEIARRSFEFRTLGLGYANVGTLLMVAGIPYDSDEGRAVCGAITSILTAESYATSARMASELGPFRGYYKNRKHMLRVIANHRRAAHDAPREEFQDLDVMPMGINADALGRCKLGAGLLAPARQLWDDALELGLQHGYRNAQVTVIAPTGTIGLLMDCDTTGVEPDFALVKFKKLAGGGYFKIANQSVALALKNLGYSPAQVIEIMHFVMGTMRLENAPYINVETLKEKGFNEEDLRKIEDQLPSVFEMPFAFNVHVLGEPCMERLGLKPDEYSAIGFDLLTALGFSSNEIDQANDVVCGMQTVEGAPHLKEEHLKVFDCASPCGKHGQRFIHYNGHIQMMASAQSFISGAISKTINMPNDSTVEHIGEAYMHSWELGVKAIALYRDGCKLSQPLSTSMKGAETDEKKDGDASQNSVADHEQLPQGEPIGGEAAAERQSEPTDNRPVRRRLPVTRYSITHKFDVASHEGYLTVGLYEDGQPGELFITMAKEGSTVGGLMDAVGTCISMALQYGVPLQTLVDKFAHARFEPSGMTSNSEIPFAKSIIDYISRWLGITFLPGYREANTPKREEGGAEAFAIPRLVTEPGKGGNGNGNGNGGNGHTTTTVSVVRVAAAAVDAEPASDGSVLSAANSLLMGDAPPCDTCGSITVRNGTCYKCMNCGNSMGCS